MQFESVPSLCLDSEIFSGLMASVTLSPGLGGQTSSDTRQSELPLTRPADPLSPSAGERAGVRGIATRSIPTLVRAANPLALIEFTSASSKLQEPRNCATKRVRGRS